MIYGCMIFFLYISLNNPKMQGQRFLNHNGVYDTIAIAYEAVIQRKLLRGGWQSGNEMSMRVGKSECLLIRSTSTLRYR